MKFSVYLNRLVFVMTEARLGKTGPYVICAHRRGFSSTCTCAVQTGQDIYYLSVYFTFSSVSV